jgi:gamma-glutamyltranspeptidase/glutathione hydrolase
MVATSVPLAASAGLEMLRRGGNAIDAALAMAAALCVVEPMQTGIGGDAFALFWSAREHRMVGLNGSGRAPAAATLEAYRARGLERVPATGILSVTVPGAVHAWETLSKGYGALPLGEVLAPAIRAAADGFPVSELVAHYWQLAVEAGALRNDAAKAALAPAGGAPAAGETFRNPRLARTLQAIAERGAAGFYAGPVADAIVATSRAEGGLLAHDDLAAHRSDFVEPLEIRYRNVRVAELPPNGQGVTALQALAILNELEAADAPIDSVLDWHRRIEAVKLAFADRDAYVGDPDAMQLPWERLLDGNYAAKRAFQISHHALAGVRPGFGSDTVYCCAADAEGNLVSFIQSLFGAFGSGIGCGDTGVILQNRGSGFRLVDGHPNAVGPRKRPLHTIIPGMLLREFEPWIAFGIMGGDIQPQAHAAFVANLVDHGLNPQEALDRPRFRWLGGLRVLLETPELRVREGGFLSDALEDRGHQVEAPGSTVMDRFGGGQAIARERDGLLVGASDRRKDGCALGLHP